MEHHTNVTAKLVYIHILIEYIATVIANLARDFYNRDKVIHTVQGFKERGLAATRRADQRRDVGMVFQKPNPFPMSIYDNIAYGPRTHGITSKVKLDEIVEQALRGAAIWDEVKDRLKKNALGLSGGQQQRLCIARALAVEPKVLLMDEPTSALDPISTSRIEELALQLKEKYTIIIVTHNMQQAVRISDNTAFFLLGELVEFGETEKVFSQPIDKRTEDYITGRFG